MAKQTIFLITILVLVAAFMNVDARNTNVANSGEFLSAYSGAAAGDTITITANLVFTSQVAFIRSGTASNPIVIRGNNIARVRCSCSYTSTAGAYLINANYNTFQNILFVDKGQPFSGKTTQYRNPYPPGTGAANGNYAWGLFENEYVSTRFEPVHTQGTIFKNCEWRGAFYRLVDASDVNFEMYNCVIDNIANRETLFGHLVDCRMCNNVKIVNCKFKWSTAYRHYAVANKCGTQAGTDWGKGLLVEGCYFYFPVPKGETWVDPALCLGPYTEGNMYGANEYNKNFIVRYNLFVNCAYTPISIEACSHADIYNNTFVNCGINPNWEAEEALGAGAGWPVICNIRIADTGPEPSVTVGEGSDGRVRYVNICNNIFWSNHQANLDAGHIYLVDAFGISTVSTKGADIPGLNVDGNMVWHTANATKPDTVTEDVNCHGNDSWATALNVPLKNTVRKDPAFVNATGDTDGDYRPSANDLPAPISFTKYSTWAPQITSVDPQGLPIGNNYVGAINPAGSAGVQSSPITPFNDGMADVAVMPNPYTGSSGHVYFTLPRAAEITVALYDLNGRRVKVIEQGQFERGRWVSPVRYQELPAGEYILRLSDDGGLSASRKVLIRK